MKLLEDIMGETKLLELKKRKKNETLREKWSFNLQLPILYKQGELHFYVTIILFCKL